MTSISKLGPYINKLMTTILDKEKDEFVVNLALDELNRLNIDIGEFILKNSSKDDDGESEETETPKKQEKQLLQEDKKDVTNK